MKSLQAISLSLLAGAFAGTAVHAQTVLHICGSTAFRAPATAAMIDYLSTTGTGKVYAGYSGSSLLGASAAILANGTIGSGGTATIEIETYWTGSLAGLVDIVAGNNTGAYLDPSSIGSSNITAVNNTANNATVGSANNSTVYGGGVALTSPGTVTSVPDFTFSDSHKQTIQAELATATLVNPIGSYSSIGALAAACGGSTVLDAGSPSDPGNSLGANANSDGLVGVVPFEICSGNGAPSSITNITEQTLKTLLGQGLVDQSLFTGVSGTGNSFYLTGRNEDSGTRIDTYSEAQFGVTAAPKQYALPAFTLFPANSTLNTEPNIKWSAAGHSGYASGGNVATALDSAETAPKFGIGYLGITDAATAVTGGAKALTYDGVPFSVANVQNGLYTVWGYEHAYYLSTLSGTAKTVADAIADGVHDTNADIAGNGKHSAVSGDVAAGILYDANFNVYRPVQPEGGPISHF